MFIIAPSTAPDVSNSPGSSLMLVGDRPVALFLGHALGGQELG